MLLRTKGHFNSQSAWFGTSELVSVLPQVYQQLLCIPEPHRPHKISISADSTHFVLDNLATHGNSMAPCCRTQLSDHGSTLSIRRCDSMHCLGETGWTWFVLMTQKGNAGAFLRFIWNYTPTNLRIASKAFYHCTKFYVLESLHILGLPSGVAHVPPWQYSPRCNMDRWGHGIGRNCAVVRKSKSFLFPGTCLYSSNILLFVKERKTFFFHFSVLFLVPKHQGQWVFVAHVPLPQPGPR